MPMEQRPDIERARNLLGETERLFAELNEAHSPQRAAIKTAQRLRDVRLRPGINDDIRKRSHDAANSRLRATQSTILKLLPDTNRLRTRVRNFLLDTAFRHTVIKPELDRVPDVIDHSESARVEAALGLLLELKVILLSAIEALRAPVGPDGGKGKREKRRLKGPDPDAETIKGIRLLIVTIHSELAKGQYRGSKHEAICKPLHNYPRPPGAKWKQYSWPVAYSRPEYRESVRAWISKALRQTS